MKTVSLETAKALKKAGFNQYTSCRHLIDTDGRYWFRIPGDPWPGVKEDYAAPTSDELMEQLPSDVHLYKQVYEGVLNLDKGTWWFVTYKPPGHDFMDVHRNPAECLAKVYLEIKKDDPI